MKKKYFYTIAIAILTIAFFLIDNYWLPEKKPPTNNKSHSNNDLKKITNAFYLPSSTTNEVIHHNYYSFSYNERYEQAEWVAYELKSIHLSDSSRKRPYFEQDPYVRTASADWRNYKNSGYDRGHFCPAGDRRFSKEAYDETFYTSNVAPQKHSFNSGVWNRLEQKVRYWAKKYDGVFVVTGGVLESNLETIGSEGVAVPKYFYKVLLDNRKGDYKLLAFLIPHKQTDKDLRSFVVPVDTIEQLTKIDFFPKLPDAIERKKEAIKGIEHWKF